MTRDPIWRFVEWRLRRSVRDTRIIHIIGDLAEDYEAERQRRGALRSAIWLAREARSVHRAYASSARRAARPVALLGDDLRFAAKRIVRQPSAAVLCAALLSIAIGLATAMFSTLDSLLLQPAPFRDADRIVELRLWRPAPALMDAWLDSRMFDAVEAAQETTFRNAADGTEWQGALITPRTLDLLGVRPVRGRGFSTDDLHTGGPAVLISEGLWRSVYGGDEGLIGRQVALNNELVTVAGVMPASFRFPTPEARVWKALDVRAAASGATTLFGRVAVGVPLEDALISARPLVREFGRIPENYGRTRADVPPIRLLGHVNLGGFAPRAIWLLTAGAALVFLALCANAMSVLLAGLSQRRRELGVCGALGASRARTLRRIAIEHALIAIAGIGGGISIAALLVGLIPGFFTGRTLNVIDIDVRAFAVASLLGGVAIFITGLAPAWIASRAEPLDALRSSREGGTESGAARALVRLVLSVEVALAVALLVGSVGLARSVVRMMQTDRGLDDRGVVRVRVGGLDDVFASPEGMRTATEAIERQFAAWPLVSGVALSRDLPPGLTSNIEEVNDAIPSDRYRVGPSFFSLHGIRLLQGRSFSAGDAEFNAVVSERLAAALWPGQNPVGRSFSSARGRRRYAVVGVARELSFPTLDRDRDRPEFYTPLGWTSRTLYVSLRCRQGCPGEREILERVLAVHPGLRPRVTVITETTYAEQLLLPAATSQIASIFAVVALLTAAGGLFSVLTYSLGRRRREFGIRLALGASASDIRMIVAKESAATVGAGAAAGALAGWFVARSLAAFRYEVSTADPTTWAVVLLVVMLSAVAAAARPARAAVRVNPVNLLREE